ncbi:hypothetical protein CDAR_464581 [Caerostris darwini]|uniref:Uncharacterized protein n=1 Tax=Caerostris darwini TaxID=1538125 RepID=A0AAV4Q5R2_9ARAC|nr:hypothetical protein CDAR_464581 [Caerostris darwini]
MGIFLYFLSPNSYKTHPVLLRITVATGHGVIAMLITVVFFAPGTNIQPTFGARTLSFACREARNLTSARHTANEPLEEWFFRCVHYARSHTR